MLWIIFIILMALWLVGLVTAFTLGGFIHLILVIAFTVLLAQFINTRHVV